MDQDVERKLIKTYESMIELKSTDITHRYKMLEYFITSIYGNFIQSFIQQRGKYKM